MESYPFICLIFTFFMRERLGRVHTFALCVNKLLLDFWHFQLVSCCLHCLLHLHCSDNSAAAHIHSWVKKRVQSLEKTEAWTKGEAVMDLENKSTCLAPVLVLCRGANMPGSDGDHDAATWHMLQERHEGGQFCLLSFGKVLLLNKSTFQKVFLRLLHEKEKNEMAQTPFQRCLYNICTHREMYKTIYIKYIYVFNLLNRTQVFLPYP